MNKTTTISNLNLTTWQDAFTAHIEKTYHNENTAALANQHINVFVRWYEAAFNETFNPSLLTNYALVMYRNHSLKVAKVEASTWNSRHWSLNIFCAWLGSPELMQGIEQQGGEIISEKHRALDQNEYHHLIQHCQREIRAEVTQFGNWTAVRDYALVMVMLSAGLRVAECAALDTDDIIIGERSGTIIVRNGKGSKQRKVAIERNILRPALRAWNEHRANATAMALFINARGERLTTRTIQRIVENIGRKISVPDLTPHWLRYTFAKGMEQRGVALESIRTLLGHENIETTKRYLRSSIAELQSAVEVM
jgi:integrase/recombinase XerD